jgi:hypothetical protein
MAAFRTSFAMEEIEIQLQDGQTFAIMFKDFAWQALEGPGDPREASFPFPL